MAQKPKIYCFTKYSEKGPSSRYRTFQYLPYWSQYYDIKLNCLLDDWYFDKQLNFFSKGFKFIESLQGRLHLLKKINPSELVWIEYELFPYLGAFSESRLKSKGIRFILDFDDAIFHWYGNHNWILIRVLLRSKIEKLMRMSSAVVTGSPYLTAYSKRINDKTLEIPTSINLSQYLPGVEVFKEKRNDCFTIGWLGSRTTSANLGIIKAAFIDFIKEVNAELWLMGYDEAEKAHWMGLPVRFFDWSAERETSFLKSIDAGIMPLFDTPFNKGKCGFKLIQYMAMCKPTISTPLEANVMIDRAKVNYFANDSKEWLDAFRMVWSKSENIDYNVNRNVVSEFYNAAINEAKYRRLFESVNNTNE